MSLGQRLKRYRKGGLHMSAQRFATMLQEGDGKGTNRISAETIRNLEKQRREDITLGQLAQISKALNVPALALLVDFEPLRPFELSDIAAFSRLGMTNLDVVGMFAGTMPDECEKRTNDSRTGLRERMSLLGDLRVLAESLSRDSVLHNKHDCLLNNTYLLRRGRNRYHPLEWEKRELENQIFAEGQTLFKECMNAIYHARAAITDADQKRITRAFSWIPAKSGDTSQKSAGMQQSSESIDPLLKQLDECITSMETSNRTTSPMSRFKALKAYISARECIYDLNVLGYRVDKERTDRLDEALRNVHSMEETPYKVRQS